MFSKSVFMSVVLILVFSGSSMAVISTFDTGTDGWTGDIGWYSTNGNPGGHLYFQDDLYVSNASVVSAPTKFLGDWSALDGVGTLSYDHKIFSISDAYGYLPYGVFIYSGDNWARCFGDTPSGPTDWVNISIPIDSGSWVVKQGTWEDIISNVTELVIRIELVSDYAHADIEGIDNVNLIPEPASMSLLAIGGLLLRSIRRRKL